MREHTVKLYPYDELADDAKAKARQWFIESNPEYFLWDDAYASLNVFCRAYGVTIEEVRVYPWGGGHVQTDATNQTFRGVKLRSIDLEAMPTGYCADLSLGYVMYDEVKRTGDALFAFNAALDSWIQDTARYWEAQYDEECVADTLKANCYEFLEDGTVYR